MTCFTVQKAKGWPADTETGETLPTEKPQKAYYAFVPIAVAGDVATFPLQLIVLCAYSSTGTAQAEDSGSWQIIDWRALGQYFTR